MPPATTRKHILLLMDTSFGYCRGVRLGVLRGLEANPGWTLSEKRTLEPKKTQRVLLDSPPDGIIAHISKTWLLEMLLELGVPVVNTSRVAHRPFPTVGCNDFVAGRIAAEHLIERGLRRFILLDNRKSTLYGDERRASFVQALEQRGLSDYTILPLAEDLTPEHAEKPVGVFTTNDTLARSVFLRCKTLDLRVPDQVSIIGIDNDDQVVGTTQTPLTSVQPPTEQIGLHALRTLKSTLEGRPPPTEPVLLIPPFVAERGSTGMDHETNPLIAGAQRYIREHLTEPISVATVVQHIGVSRSKLETDFRRELNMTPLEMIHQARVKRASKLLIETDMTMPSIAAASGFSDPAQLWRVFRKRMDMSPDTYRKQFRVR